MNIDSIFFISCFLPLCVAVCCLIPGLKGKNWALLIVGLVFYSFGSLSGLGLLLASGIVNYLLLLAVSRGKGGKWAVAAGVAGNLAFLGAFKYLDFLLGQVLGLPQLELGLAAPIGISFFTFKSISCLIDAHRDPEQGRLSFPDYLLYISFFTQIMAGPITRWRDFGPQLAQRSVSAEGAAKGIRRFVAGLGKKLILAGTLGAMVDRVFAMEALDVRLAWLGAVGYSLQIYFDFSGYSDMAIGLGQLFGFRTAENFDHPYIASTLGDFWRRWHISLSSWFRDYLYIPLGGNRKGQARAAQNKAIVFTLCGIWHGAAWTFVLWGAWHGLLSALESVGVIPAKKLRGTVLGHVYTLLVVCLGFVMFRAETVSQGLAVIGAMFTGFSFTAEATVLLGSILTPETLVMLAAGAVISMPAGKWLAGKERLQPVLEPVSYGLSLLLLVVCLGKLASGGFAPFIYSQF